MQPRSFSSGGKRKLTPLWQKAAEKPPPPPAAEPLAPSGEIVPGLLGAQQRRLRVHVSAEEGQAGAAEVQARPAVHQTVEETLRGRSEGLENTHRHFKNRNGNKNNTK